SSSGQKSNLSRRNYTVPIPRRKLRSSRSFLGMFLSLIKSTTAISSKTKLLRERKDYLSTSSLPALEEDIPESSSILRGFSLEPEFKNIASTRCGTIHLSKKSESFLPPIERKSPVPANVKLVCIYTLFFM
ncbi:hypothetical protein AVEN_272471-1, partial [Araneus ventricosus]